MLLIGGNVQAVKLIFTVSQSTGVELYLDTAVAKTELKRKEAWGTDCPFLIKFKPAEAAV